MSMQFRTLLILAALLFAPVLSTAGGFSGPGAQAVTRAIDVSSVHSETPCTLEGRILEKINGNRYLFEDGSGRAVVAIKREVFGNSTVTPNDIVRIVGAVDWNGKRPNVVDVQSIRVMPHNS